MDVCGGAVLEIEKGMLSLKKRSPRVSGVGETLSTISMFTRNYCIWV